LSKHNAPSVVYPLERSRLQGLILLGLWVLGLLVIVLWAGSSHMFGWQQALGIALLAGAGMTAASGWRNCAVGQLAWDGQSWRWESQGYQAGAVDHVVSVALDGQAVMLLCVENPARTRLWLWAERRVCPERWLDLRRAVYSPQRDSSSQAIPA
jgi:toxin CptA